MVTVAAALLLLPSLWRGFSFGPFDILSEPNLGHGLYQHVHNPLSSDQITETIPEDFLTWQELHRLQLPLWNDRSGLGMPQLFDFIPAVFSLPNIISYAFPANIAFLVAVFLKLLIAGLGTFFFCRALGTSTRASLLGAVTYELSGAFVAYLGWQITDVFCWMGWIMAMVYLIMKRGSQAWYILALALAIAFAFFGGFPEAYVMVGIASLSFIVFLLIGAPRGTGLSARGTMTRIAGVTGGAVIGFSLAAPLLLPGIHLALMSLRDHINATGSIPLRTFLPSVLFQGYYGYPLHGSMWFGPLNYYELEAYVGAIPVILAGMSFLSTRLRQETFALAGTFIVLFLLTYTFPPIRHMARMLPYFPVINFGRARLILTFILAALAAIGFDEFMKGTRSLQTFFITLGIVGTIAVTMLLKLWTFGIHRTTFGQMLLALRQRSLDWTIVFLCLVLIVALYMRLFGHRRNAAAGNIIISLNMLSLLGAGMAINSYSHRFFPDTSALRQVKTIVGKNLVGVWRRSNDRLGTWTQTGIFPEANIGYGLKEFGIYDPMIPARYYSSFNSRDDAAIHLDQLKNFIFEPSIDSITTARLYGIRYVLAPTQGCTITDGPKQKLISIFRAISPNHPGIQDASAVALLMRHYCGSTTLRQRYPINKSGSLQSLLDWAEHLGAAGRNKASYLRLLHYSAQFSQIDLAIKKRSVRAGIRALLVTPEEQLKGARMVWSKQGTSLYNVPHSSRFTINGIGNRIIGVTHPNNYTWRVRLAVRSPATLYARLTDIPGWHVYNRNVELPSRRWHHIMQAVKVAPGKQSLVFVFWPTLFTVGIYLSLAALATILILGCQPRILNLRGHPARAAGRPSDQRGSGFRDIL